MNTNKRVSKKCEHGRQKYNCVLCGGKGICSHGKRKSRCKPCNGSAFCEHDIIKSRCLKCDGSEICEHGIRKNMCRTCDGSSFCEHNIRKSTCRKCHGSEICEHNIRKSVCQDCKGNSLCEHNIRKTVCKNCNGTSICIHGCVNTYCAQCKGIMICEHGKHKNRCKLCNFQLYLVNLQRGGLNRVLKQSSIIKTGHSIEYLGCNSIYFKDYIQSKMIDGMNWDNIHLDHIKPINAFNLDDENELLDCCHYTNFQPLLAKDNISKGAKWSETDELFWVENIKRKEYLPLYFPV